MKRVVVSGNARPRHRAAALVLLASVVLALLGPAPPGRAQSPTQLGAGAIFLPLVAQPGTSVQPFTATLELNANESISPGDRVRVDVTFVNRGTVAARGILFQLPFDKGQLRFFTYAIDIGAGDRFLGVTDGEVVEIAVNRLIEPGRRHTISVWFVVNQGVVAGTQLRLRGTYTFASQQRATNQLRFTIIDQDTNAFCGPFRGTNGRMAVDPPRGAVGTLFQFSSDCFEPNETVVTWLNTPAGVQDVDLSADADGSGFVRFTFNSRNIPPSDRYGFVAQGLSSGIQVLGPFIVTASTVAQGTPALPNPAAEAVTPVVPSQTGFNTIQGVVRSDAGLPLAEVPVALYDAGDTVVGTDVTDAEGRYEIGGLRNGAYTLHVLAGFSPDPVSAIYGSIARELVVIGTLPVTVDVVLARGGRVAGTVTGSDGPLLGGVAVFVYNTADDLLGTAVTDAAGTYTTTALVSGTYRLEFDPSFSDVLSSTAYLSRTVTGVVVTPTLTTALSVVLEADPELRQIGGQVTSATSGEGLADVQVVFSTSDGEVADLATTDEQGYYRSARLEAGTYRITFRTIYSNSSVTLRHIGAVYPLSVTLQAPGVHSDVNLALQPGTQVSGRVTALDTGLPLEAVEVVVRNPSLAVIDVKLTNAQGRFVTAGLPNGRYTLEFDTSAGRAPTTYYTPVLLPIQVLDSPAPLTGVDVELGLIPVRNIYLPFVIR